RQSMFCASHPYLFVLMRYAHLPSQLHSSNESALNASAISNIDLRRMRHARHRLLSYALSDPYYDSQANTRVKVALLAALLRKNAPDVPMAALREVLGFELGRTAEVCNNPGARG